MSRVAYWVQSINWERERNAQVWSEVPPDVREGIPAHLRDGLDLYFGEWVETGGFLRAVLENDLAGALTRADATLSIQDLRALVQILWTWAPGEAWGSKAAVEAWLARGRTLEAELALAHLADP